MAQQRSGTPFFDARTHRVEYVGPGRETPPPAEIDEVLIGYFGPSDPQHPAAGLMWQAATLAVEEANEAGGYQGVPFRLIASWSDNPWGTGIKGITQLVYEQEVWALLGAPDGPSAHLAEQVVAKARLPFISTVSTDPSTNLTNVPWIFSCAPSDSALAPALAEAIAEENIGQALAIVSATDHDSRGFTSELTVALQDRSIFPTIRLDLRPGSTGFSAHLHRLREADPDAIVVVAAAADGARFLSGLRENGLTQPVYAGPAAGREAFARLAATSAEGVVFPLLWHRGTAARRSRDFAEKFTTRFGPEPDYTAAYTYDGATLLIAAIRRAGLNRARIRDAVADLSPWPGVTGPITWNLTGQNVQPVDLGAIRRGRCVLRRSGAVTNG